MLRLQRPHRSVVTFLGLSFALALRFGGNAWQQNLLVHATTQPPATAAVSHSLGTIDVANTAGARAFVDAHAGLTGLVLILVAGLIAIWLICHAATANTRIVQQTGLGITRINRRSEERMMKLARGHETSATINIAHGADDSLNLSVPDPSHALEVVARRELLPGKLREGRRDSSAP